MPGKALRRRRYFNASTSWTSIYSTHVSGNGDGFSWVPPLWCHVPSLPLTRTRAGSLKQTFLPSVRSYRRPYLGLPSLANQSFPSDQRGTGTMEAGQLSRLRIIRR